MAIQVVDNFKNAMKAPVKVIGADVFIADGDAYSSEDSLVKAEIQSSGYFFGVSTKTASITLLGTSYTLLNKSLSINLRVLSSAGSWLNCVLGQFQVTEQTTDLEKGMTTIKAYDAIGMAALKPYSAGDMNPPITINALASRIASNCGMEYDDTAELLIDDLKSSSLSLRSLSIILDICVECSMRTFTELLSSRRLTLIFFIESFPFGYCLSRR